MGYILHEGISRDFRVRGTPSWTASMESLQVGGMESQIDWNPWLVEGVIGSARGVQLQMISMKNMGFI